MHIRGGIRSEMRDFDTTVENKKNGLTNQEAYIKEMMKCTQTVEKKSK